MLPNGAPYVVRWPAIAVLPSWPGSWVSGVVARTLAEIVDVDPFDDDLVDADLGDQ